VDVHFASLIEGLGLEGIERPKEIHVHLDAKRVINLTRQDRTALRALGTQHQTVMCRLGRQDPASFSLAFSQVDQKKVCRGFTENGFEFDCDERMRILKRVAMASGARWWSDAFESPNPGCDADSMTRRAG